MLTDLHVLHYIVEEKKLKKIMIDSSRLTTLENGQNKNSNKHQTTLFGEVPENDIESNSSLSQHSEDTHSTIVEAKNRINSTTKYNSNDMVAVINIDNDGKCI